MSGLALTGLGLATAGCVAAGLGLGWFLDRQAGTAPLFLLVGMGSGSLLGVLGFYRETRKYLKD